ALDPRAELLGRTELGVEGGGADRAGAAQARLILAFDPESKLGNNRRPARRPPCRRLVGAEWAATVHRAGASAGVETRRADSIGKRMEVVLTGIKPTGTLHIGNYVGAIKPSIAASASPRVASYFFLADYHAIGGDAELVARTSLEIAASWLSLGLD